MLLLLLINDKVDVINFIRDTRGDWGDDGGYCFYTGLYNGKYILGSNYISYNIDFSSDFIGLEGLEAQDENEEYMFFDSISDIKEFIKRMLDRAKALTIDDEDWGYDSWELDEEEFESHFMSICIRNLGSAFCEYTSADTAKLLNLTSPDGYTPRLLDPVEFYDGWA